jgi:uncharacterized protein (TIGR03118 family)
VPKISLVSLCLAAALVVGAQPVSAQFYTQHNLVSDDTTLIPADFPDPDLINAWGLAAGAMSPWWVADAEVGKSTIYDAAGVKQGLVVTVPGNPTGLVSYGGAGFVVSSGGAMGSARFIFASEDGTISAWAPAVPPPAPSTQAHVVITTPEANYKGLAFGQVGGADRLYAANFHAGTVDVFDGSFNPVMPPAFLDPTLPAGYAPFGIQNLGGFIYVTYALQDVNKADEVPGPGFGFVNVFDTAGKLIRRVASKGPLNAPWGLAVAPAGFGKFSGALLVGQFGDGTIHAFGPVSPRTNAGFQHLGVLESATGVPIEIDGLWALQFGNGAAAGPTNVLFFTAGPLEEEHGLFGKIEANP